MPDPKFLDVRFAVATAVTVLFAVAYLLPILRNTPVDPSLREQVTAFQETTKAAFVAAWSYYLGSSVSSAAKDKLIATLRGPPG